MPSDWIKMTYLMLTLRIVLIFNTQGNLQPLVMETFENLEYEGRKVNVEVSTKPGRSGGRSRKRGKTDGKRFFSDDRKKSKGHRKGSNRSKGGRLPKGFN
jgi:ATP-dependent RNA helicase DeaD